MAGHRQLQQLAPDVCWLLGGPCGLVAWLSSNWEQAPLLVTPGDSIHTRVPPSDVPVRSSSSQQPADTVGAGELVPTAVLVPTRGAAAAVQAVHQGAGAHLGLGAAELWESLLPRCVHCPPPPAGRVDPLQVCVLGVYMWVWAPSTCFDVRVMPHGLS